MAQTVLRLPHGRKKGRHELTEHILSDWKDPANAVELVNEQGKAPLLLLCEHGSPHIPAEYGDLGLQEADRFRHIAWDIGAAALTRRLSLMLDAPAIIGKYSRLLFDLNRPPDSGSAIPAHSERTDIPGNRNVGPAERQRRYERIFLPFHHRVAAHLDERASSGKSTSLISIHSFTQSYDGIARPWHAGVLFSRSRELGERIATGLREDPELIVGINEPYRISSEEDYSIPVHGDQRDVPAVLLEIRNDGLTDEPSLIAWSERLTRILSKEAAPS